MSLALGARLGPYAIVSALGAGGMGEVYRATDTKLKRQVAVKILPPVLAADPDRLARFQREAEVLASLNHPHIAAIYGVESADGINALVMELVEGDDLAQQIARGPVPLDEALPIAKQIAEALEAAHEAGVIHRDLKPANIKVRADGTVKVLDFGLAKLAEPDAAHRAGREVSAPLPTITSPAMMTGIGVILGTAAYMAPEQARGHAADKRADIWAFGAVVFEMLTGDRAFTGETISDTLASVLKTDPNWNALPRATPRRLRALLRWCLTRDPKRRLRDIGDARAQIEDLIAAPGETDVAAIAVTTPVWRRLLPWALTGALAAGLTTVLIVGVPWRQALETPPIRLSAELGTDASLAGSAGDSISLSRDGTLVAFVAQKAAAGSPQLYVRRLNETAATALSGTEGADSPFFSPDGRWIGFFADGKLKKIAVKGGATITLADAPISRGGDWGEDDTIVFLPARVGGLMRVSAASPGGTPEPVAPVAAGEATQRWPQLLPGGKGLLFTSNTGAGNHDEANIVVQTLPAGERIVVQKGGYHGRYVSSGHLVYLHQGTLFATPFDLDQMRPTGPAVPAVEGVTSNGGTGSAWFAVSDSGTFAYVPGPSVGGEGIPIHWMDREGKTTPLRTTRVPWLHLVFSPDGDRLAFQVIRGAQTVWVYDWARDAPSPLTSDPASATNPAWTPDGRRIAFASARVNKPATNVYWQRADGTGDAQQLTEGTNTQRPGTWHPSGRFLAFEELNPVTKSDLMILPMEGDEKGGWKPGKPTVFANMPFDERQPAFSPDGRWLAYVSNEAGRDEVYVRPFKGSGKSAISAGGGSTPTWSRTKPELFYGIGAASSGIGQIMVVPYSVEGDSLRPGKPQVWSQGRYQTRGPSRMFDLHPDGARFAIAPPSEIGAKRDHVTFLFNFSDELRRIAPPSR